MYRFGKRAFDIFFSVIAIIVTVPLSIIMAAAIKWCDGGPVFYTQTRVTKDGRLFEICKFRSMRTDAEEDGIARLSTGAADDRVTPVGKIIRRYRLDEIPQFWNILKGDMSIVGPRPERPELYAVYCRDLPAFRQRLCVKAGLTGYAQVFGKYDTPAKEKLEMDLNYIENAGIMEDLFLCIATIPVLWNPDKIQKAQKKRKVWEVNKI